MTNTAAGAPHTVAHRPGKPRRTGNWARRLPLLPALIFVILLTQIPWIVTLVISTLHWNALQPGTIRFAGLENYVTVFTDPRLRAALVNTVVMTLSAVIISMLLGIAFALLLHRKFLGRGIVRTLMIAPFLVMPIATALLWKHSIFNPSYGLINGILTWFQSLLGGNAVVQIDWVSSFPMAAVVTSLVWQWTPFMMLIVLSGLQSQSEEILEAARVDGAGAVASFRYITLPQLMRYIQLGVLLGTVYIVQTYDTVYAITQGGPGTATTNLPYEIYLTTFRKFAYGEAAAAGVIVVILSLIVANFALKAMRALLEDGTSR